MKYRYYEDSINYFLYNIIDDKNLIVKIFYKNLLNNDAYSKRYLKIANFIYGLAYKNLEKNKHIINNFVKNEINKLKRKQEVN